MSTLFTEDDTDDTELDTTSELATPKQVRLLEGYGRNKDVVRGWTKEHAESVLRTCQAEERQALRRADAVAENMDGKRRPPSRLERLIAAKHVEDALKESPGELYQAVMYTVYVLSDEELESLAKYLMRKYREQPAREAGK